MDFTGSNESFLDLTDVEVGGQKQEPLKPGEYLAMITKAEVKNTRGEGKAISLLWKVIEGESAGKHASDFIMYKHTNADAQRIGRERLKGILVCAGKEPVIKAISDLVNLKAIIGTRLEEYEGKHSARVTYYEPAPKDVQDQVL